MPASRNDAVSVEKSSATHDSATMPAVPPTSWAGTTRSVPRPTASIVRGPPFIATSGKPNSDWNTPAVARTSSAPMTKRLRRSGDGSSSVGPGGVASSTSTPEQARG